MRQFHEHFIATYPLLTGGNRTVEVFGTVKWNSVRSRLSIGAMKWRLPSSEIAAFRLPMQSGELDIDALRILVNALVMRDVSRTA